MGSELTQEMLDGMVEEAMRAPPSRRASARAAFYDPGRREIVVTLEQGGGVVRLPVDWLQVLSLATDEELSGVEVWAESIAWPALDHGMDLPTAMEGRVGNDLWMSLLEQELGRLPGVFPVDPSGTERSPVRPPEPRLSRAVLLSMERRATPWHIHQEPAQAAAKELFPAETKVAGQSAVIAKLREYVDAWRGFPLESARLPYPEDPAAYEPVKAWERPVSPVTRTLLQHWFRAEPHVLSDGMTFKYWPHQRRAVETLVYLHEVCGIRRTPELFALTGVESPGPQSDPWTKFGAELATGSGKTKIMSLVLAWAYFNALRYGEAYLGLGRQALVVAPGLFVRDRLLLDFRPDDGSPPIFLKDPVLPPELRDLWDYRVYGPDDCPLALDPAQGALVVTNYHRLLNDGDETEELLEQTREEQQLGLLFGGREPKKLEEVSTPLLERFVHARGLLVINDEAHRVGDEPQHARFEKKTASKTEEKTVEMAWIRGLRNLNGSRDEPGRVGLQVDLSATLFEEAGIETNTKTLFRHTALQYDLAEARRDGIIKRPVLEKVKVTVNGVEAPLQEASAANAWDMHRVLVETGIERWKKVRTQFVEEGDPRKPLLLMLCADKSAAKEIANYLTYGEATSEDLSHRPVTGWKDPRTGELLFAEPNDDGSLRSTVIEVHVGEKEKNEKAWEQTRRLVNFIDRDHVASAERDDSGRPKLIPNPYNVIVSVLMLREGWDVRNVKVIVPLRPCGSRTLTEQVLGRGLRKMHPPAIQDDGAVLSRDEELYVIEHPSFAKIIDKVKDLVDEKDPDDIDHTPEYAPITPRPDEAERIERDVRLVRFDGLIEEVADWRRELDVKQLPPLAPRAVWLDEVADKEVETTLLSFDEAEREGLQFRLRTQPAYADFEAVLSNAYVAPLLEQLKTGFLHRTAIKGVVREFLEQKVFAQPRGMRPSFEAGGDPETVRVVLQNIARGEVAARVRAALLPVLQEAMKAPVPVARARLIEDRASDLPAYQALRDHLLDPAQKSPYLRQATANDLELRVARLLDRCVDVTGWVYNHRRAPGYAIDYVWRHLSVPYYPDFLVRARSGQVAHNFIVEVKGRFDPRDRAKAEAGRTLCATLTRYDKEPWHYLFLLENPSFGRADVTGLEALNAPSLVEALRQQEEHGLVPGEGPLPLGIVDPGIEETVAEADRWRTAVPVFDLTAQAGGFSPEHVPEPRGWMRVRSGRRLHKSMFVARIEGRSMEPGVPAGSWCLFRSYASGAPSTQALDGRRLLVQLRRQGLEEAAFTLKRLRVTALDENGDVREVELSPDNPAFSATRATAGPDELVVLAELVDVVS